MKASSTIVGRSDENLSSALLSVSNLPVQLSIKNEEDEDLSILDKKKRNKTFAAKSINTKATFGREPTSNNQQSDLFLAARYGNLAQIKKLYSIHRDNPKVFFNRIDPETKLTALHYAVRFQHLHICQYLIEQCQANVDQPGEDSMTPLHYIARFRIEKTNQNNADGNYEATVRYLIQQRADINKQDDYLYTPLHYACERDNVRCAEILIFAGANIEAEDRQLMRPLHNACFYGSVNAARLLISHGADITSEDGNKSIPFAYACLNSHDKIFEMFFTEFAQNEKSNEIIQSVDAESNTLLHLAVASADEQIVQLLLNKKAQPTAKRLDGQTPMHLCAKTNSRDILNLLIQAGGILTDVDNQNETILHKASAHNKDNILRDVLTQQNNSEFVQKKNNAGDSALLIAAAFGHTVCVQVLLEFGADMFDDRDKHERSAIYLASKYNRIQTLETLLEYARNTNGIEKERAAIDEIDRYGRTALHTAAESGHSEIVRILLERNCSFKIKDDDEYTPLMLCCKKNRQNVLDVFIQFLDETYSTTRSKLLILEERDDESNTALHIAATEGHSSIIRTLLEQKCDIQSFNMIAWLPIHCAAERGRYNSVQVLLEYHSPVDPTDKNEQTPLHLAARSGHSDVVKLLLKNDAVINARTLNGENCLDLAISTNQYTTAETLIKQKNWKLILRNAKFDVQNQRWDTPLRKLIRKMPDLALIVLNQCFHRTENKMEDYSNENKKPTKKTRKEYFIQLEEQIKNPTENQLELTGLTKDETQMKKLVLVYTYEFLDDQFLLKEWQKGTNEDFFEPDGRLYPTKFDSTVDRKLLHKNHPLTIMVDKNREDLLEHPLVRSLLDYKWTYYARYVYYANFFVYLLFVTCLTTYVFLTFAPYRFGITHNQMNDISCLDLCLSIQRNHTEEIKSLKARILTIHIFQWLVVIFASIQIVKEFSQMISQRLDYINLENAIELTAFIFSIIFTIDFNECSRDIGYRCVIQWQIGALSIFLTWFALVLFIQKFPRFGIYVVMLTHILRTFSRFFLVFFLFIIGFALAFHMLLQNHNAFQYFGNSLLKTCVMMIGEFEYEGIFHGDEPNYFSVTYFFFVIFIVIMSVIIMNLLVGLAVDDIAAVMRVAAVKRLEMRISLTLDVERQLPLTKFFNRIRQFRIFTHESSKWQKICSKYFHIRIESDFDKNFARLEKSGLIQTNTNTDVKKSSSLSSTSTTDINKTSDWTTNMHAQISAKYNEFNRHMSNLKTQQEKIQNIIQQFQTSRQNSRLAFHPTSS